MALQRDDAPAWLRAAYDEREGDLSSETVERIIAHFEALGVRAEIEKRVLGRYHTALKALDAARAREPARSYLRAICEALVSRRT
jgi:geranylgeranyl pyrophosphate synthase